MAGAGGGNFTFAPTIHIAGNANKSDVESALHSAKNQFERWFKEMMDNERRRSM
jgi:ethanolamine utilization microcompartment shell protein EutL